MNMAGEKGKRVLEGDVYSTLPDAQVLNVDTKRKKGLFRLRNIIIMIMAAAVFIVSAVMLTYSLYWLMHISPDQDVAWNNDEQKMYDDSRTCLYQKDKGNCNGAIARWYFNLTSEQCEIFDYSGCGGNSNNFDSLQMCNELCHRYVKIESKPEEKENPCETFYEPGGCFDNILRYFYDKDDDDCKAFLYSGCGGNNNNFLSIKDCSSMCQGNTNIEPKIIDVPTVGDRCKMNPDAGPCDDNYKKWYFDAGQGRCDVFSWGGCFGNDNKFDTELECKAACESGIPETGDICRLPAEIGNCRAAVPKFYFNWEKNRCEPFIYGGCGGNENNFDTEEECATKCNIG